MNSRMRVEEDDDVIGSGMMIGIDENEGIVELHIKGVLATPEVYTNELGCLRAYTKQYSTLKVFINSPGGSMFTAVELLGIFEEYETVITVGTGIVMSAGFILWAHGTIRTLTPYTSMMIHREQYGSSGYTMDHLGRAAHHEDVYGDLYQAMIDDGIITEDEYFQSRNTNVFIASKDMLNRGVALDYLSVSDLKVSELPVSVRTCYTITLGEVVVELVDGTSALCTVANDDCSEMDFSGMVFNVYDLMYNRVTTFEQLRHMVESVESGLQVEDSVVE